MTQNTLVHHGQDTENLKEPVWVFGDGVREVHTPTRWTSPHGTTQFQYHKDETGGKLLIHMSPLTLTPLMMNCTDGKGLMTMNHLADVVVRTILENPKSPELVHAIRKNALGIGHMAVIFARILKRLNTQMDTPGVQIAVLMNAKTSLELAVAALFEALKTHVEPSVYLGFVMDLNHHMERAESPEH